LILLLAVPASVFSQSVKLDSVNDAIQYAFDHNPDLQIYQQNQVKASKDYNAVKNYWMPTLSASFSGVDNIDLPVTKVPGEMFGQPGNTIEAEFGQKFNYNAGLNISKNILDFQSRFVAKAAKVNVEIASAKQDAYQQNLAEQVALYYYMALVTTRALQVNEKDYENSRNIQSIVEQKYEQGIVDQYAVNLVKMNRNTIFQNISSYKILLDQCHSQLRILFGVSAETEIKLNNKLEPADVRIPAQNIGYDKNLEIFSLQMEQSEYLVKQQKAMWMPKLSVNYYLGAQQYRDNSGISFENKNWSNVKYVSLNISVPLFNGFNTKNKVNSAQIAYKISKSTLEQEINRSRIEDELILKEFIHSQTAAEAAEENYQLARENADFQRRKFEEGLVSLDAYLDVFDDYLKVETSYLNALSESFTHYSKIVSRNY
jgi:outer membrane protein TolC